MNLVDTWPLRPEATTAIPNLFLASDYVRTYTDLATMEGANEAARRAVNGLLDAASSTGRAAICGRCTSPRSLRLGGCTTPPDSGRPAVGRFPDAGRRPRVRGARRSRAGAPAARRWRRSRIPWPSVEPRDRWRTRRIGAPLSSAAQAGTPVRTQGDFTDDAGRSRRRCRRADWLSGASGLVPRHARRHARRRRADAGSRSGTFMGL